MQGDEWYRASLMGDLMERAGQFCSYTDGTVAVMHTGKPENSRTKLGNGWRGSLLAS